MNIDLGIAYIKENNDKRIKVTMNSFRGEIYVHIREYGFDGDTGKDFPTPKGIALDPRGLDSVINLLINASNILAKKFEQHKQYELDLVINERENNNGN